MGEIKIRDLRLELLEFPPNSIEKIGKIWKTGERKDSRGEFE